MSKEMSYNRNPDGKGGFQERPEDINKRGSPKNEHRLSYWLQFFKGMTYRELINYAKNERNPDGMKDVLDMYAVEIIALERVLKSKDSLKEYKDLADRTEGKAPQTLIHEGGFFSDKKLIVEVVKPLEIPTDEDPKE